MSIVLACGIRNYFPDPFWIQVGVLFFTIVAMLLVVLFNNEHISNTTNLQIKEMAKGTQEQIKSFQDSTQEQVQAFAKQCQGIIAQLEKITDLLTKIFEQNIKQSEEETGKRIAAEEQVKLLKSTQEHQLQKEREEEEKYKAVISVGVYIQRAIFYDHLYICLHNHGSNVKDIKIETVFSQLLTHPAIDRDKQFTFDCGKARNLIAYDKIGMKLSVRNVKEQKYTGEISINKDNRQRYYVPLEKVQG